MSSLSLKPNKLKAYWLLLKIGIIAYALIFLISRLFLWYIVPEETLVQPPIVGQKAYWFSLAFLLFATPIIYFGNSAIAKKYIEIDWHSLILYMGLTMCFGSALELLVNYLFETIIDRPSWLYHIWPKYGGYTSGVTAIMWPLYGLHLYCFHHAMRINKSPLLESIPVRGIMMGIDAMIMEAIANIFALLTFKSYYFYYLKGDLLHFTTIEIFIPYILVGFFVMSLFYWLDRPDKPRIIIGVIALIIGWFILWNG